MVAKIHEFGHCCFNNQNDFIFDTLIFDIMIAKNHLYDVFSIFSGIIKNEKLAIMSINHDFCDQL